MPELIEQPVATARQQSGKDPGGAHILSVLAKRTYQILADGRCVPAPEQVPLVEDPQDDPDRPDLLSHDTDLYPYKPCTDVVVQGHAYDHGRRAAFHATVRIEGYAYHVLVIGNRRCALDAYGRAVFSRPEPFEKMPLRYTHAYGGADRLAEKKSEDALVRALRELPRVELERASPFTYPRNPCGRGYVVELTTESAEQLELPNLEDPYDPLSPERLVVGQPQNWLRMPLPHATDWFSYDWFPRIGYFGLVAEHLASQEPIAEVTRGFALPEILEIMPGEPSPEAAFRATCGASPALQLPHLRGGEAVQLEGMHAQRAQFSFRLPVERPQMWTDGRQGTLAETQPVIHTVVIRPDDEIVTVLWRGSAPALRPYMPEELERMPFRVWWS